jgi:hypothetical protein
MTTKRHDFVWSVEFHTRRLMTEADRRRLDGLIVGVVHDALHGVVASAHLDNFGTTERTAGA